jgi:pilus assembly protein CpaC
LAIVAGGILLTGSLALAQLPGRVGPTLVQGDPKGVPAAGDRPKAEPKTEVLDTLPSPRTVSPFGPGQLRLPAMGNDMTGRDPNFTAAPVPSAKDVEEYGRFVQEMIDPRNTLDLIVGRPRLMILKEVPTKFQMGDENTAAIEVLQPKQVTLLGRRVGTTVLNLWFTDPKDRSEKVLSYLVRVMPDPDAKHRLERVYKALEDEVNRAFPNSQIRIFLIGDKLAVSGQAHDVSEATHIIRVIRSNLPESNARNPVDRAVRPAQATDLPNGGPDSEDYIASGSPDIVNLIRIPGEQQVMLRVVVAEVNRAAARSIGMNFTIRNNAGIQIFGHNTGGVIGVAGGGGGAGGAAGLFNFGNSLLGRGNANIAAALDNGQVALAINALRNLSYARFLAEPTLTALNGQSANFLAGGQFPVPVVTGFTAAGLQGVSFVPYGVQLNFTPFVTDKDRIRLQVNANVSARDLASGATIGGAAVAGLQSRSFQTTVELREGQTLAVAGLVQNNLGADANRIPFFGDLPFVGKAFGMDRTNTSDQELVILVTPELVHPLETRDLPPLPGSNIFEPTDIEFYGLGRLESYHMRDWGSQYRTDIQKQLRRKQFEDAYLSGPRGYSFDPLQTNGVSAMPAGPVATVPAAPVATPPAGMLPNINPSGSVTPYTPTPNAAPAAKPDGGPIPLSSAPAIPPKPISYRVEDMPVSPTRVYTKPVVNQAPVTESKPVAPAAVPAPRQLDLTQPAAPAAVTAIPSREFAAPPMVNTMVAPPMKPPMTVVETPVIPTVVMPPKLEAGKPAVNSLSPNDIPTIGMLAPSSGNVVGRSAPTKPAPSIPMSSGIRPIEIK